MTKSKFDDCDGIHVTYEREIGAQIGYLNGKPMFVILLEPKGQEAFKISMLQNSVEKLKRDIAMFERWVKDPATVISEIAGGGVKS